MSAESTKHLKALVQVMGVSCTAIGAAHTALGVRSVIGVDASAGPSVDSQERFFGGIFGGYGLAWVWASRQDPIPSEVVRFLSASMAVGGVGRVLSMIERGRPHPFWVSLTAVEFAAPAAFWWLTRARERP
jgi:hypothetical protein